MEMTMMIKVIPILPYSKETTARAARRIILSRQLHSVATETVVADDAPLTNTARSSDISASAPKRSSSPNQRCRRRRRPIFVAATRQHVGKTSVSLALMSGLQKRFDRVGFIKPVGQNCLPCVEDDGTTELLADKDVVLVKEHFGLKHISYRQASPVVIPSGYTRDYLDGKITSTEQREKVVSSYRHIAESSDVVLCEGTGHCAVGSIVDASNAETASWLDARMVLVANGGLGFAMDELELNRSVAERHGVEIAGVVINKVKPDKYEQTRHYLSKALRQKWNDVPLLGCIPDRPFLGRPVLADLERLLEGSCLVSGRQHALRHYCVGDMHLIATSLDVFLKTMRSSKHVAPRTLFVCHASRNDIMLGFLMETQRRRRGANSSDDWQPAMIVTGCDDHPISTQVLEIITGMSSSSETAPPVLMANQATDKVMQAVYNYTPKLNVRDENRVADTVAHYEPYIDFDTLLSRVGYYYDAGADEADATAAGENDENDDEVIAS